MAACCSTSTDTSCRRCRVRRALPAWPTRGAASIGRRRTSRLRIMPCRRVSALATQTLRQRKQKRMRVLLNGALPEGVAVKDIILALIARIGTNGGVGYAIEYAGTAIAKLSMEARMTLCNMSIEAGSRVGMVAPDETTIAYF